MTLKMYDLTVAEYLGGLRALRSMLDKGLAHATEQGYDPANLLSARLAPDMFELKRQVQTVCDGARRGAERIAGVELSSVPDEETTFEALIARVDDTVERLKAHDPSAFDGAEDREFTANLGRDIEFTGQRFLLGFSMPNFLFHLTMVYAILRHNGVPLGKRDYIQGFMQG